MFCFLVVGGCWRTGASLGGAPRALVSGVYGLWGKAPKTADNFFLGFPSYWNIVVFYLYVLQAPLWINAFLIIALSILVFVPIKFIYPSRSPRFRVPLNILGAVWGVAVLYMIYRLPHGNRTLAFASLLFPAYYTALSLWLEFRRLTTQSSPRG